MESVIEGPQAAGAAFCNHEMSDNAMRIERASSGFVLDEGFEEDDEEVLAFEASRSERNGGRGAVSGSDPSAVVVGSKSLDPLPESVLPGESAVAFADTLVFENLPKGTTRSDIEALVGGDVEISSLKVHRFPDKTMLARIQFCEEVDAAEVLRRQSMKLSSNESSILVKYAPSDWNTFLKEHAKASASTKIETMSSTEALRDTGVSQSAVMVGGIPGNIAHALPAAEEVKATFWDAVTQAQHTAEALDNRVRAAGSSIDSKFHVAEHLDDVQKKSRALLAEADEKYKLSVSARSAMETGKARADDVVNVASSLDTSYGVSSRFSAAASKLSQAGSIAAREIDENLHLSDKVRMAANVALENEQVGPVVKSTMSHLESFWQRRFPFGAETDSGPVRRKVRPPQGIEQDSMPGMTAESVEMAAILDDEEIAIDGDVREPA